LVVAFFLALIGAGCGQDEGSETAAEEREALAERVAPSAEEATIPEGADVGDADPEAVQVIAAWSQALSSGDIEAAAAFFKLPSVAENGFRLTIDTDADAATFNRSLPCGAELTAAESIDDYTLATFELTERPGAGSCGSGTGATGSTAFVIEDGLITEWRRIGNPPVPEGNRATT